MIPGSRITDADFLFRRWVLAVYSRLGGSLPSSGMLRRVALVRTDVSEERMASIFMMTRTGELGTTLAVTSNRSTLLRNTDLTVCFGRKLLLTFLVRLFLSPVPPETLVLTNFRRGDVPAEIPNKFIPTIQGALPSEVTFNVALM
jgi:hypothetical protein